jgi:mannose-6-phosphate isomerase-like protein (cupin superfamily)
MSGPETAVGDARVFGPDDGQSFWQPVPANGFVRNIINQRMINGQTNFSLGTQTVAPGCFIREHTHPHNEEVIFIVEGRGIARVDGVEHPIEKGSCVYIGRGRKHHFLNPNSEPMTFLWLMMPGGLDQFFAEIGRARQPGDATPEPFPRPANVAEIEARTVFGWTDKQYDSRK